MVTTHRFAAPLMVLSLLVPSFSRAHIAEFEAVLDTAQEVPAPSNTIPGAGGTGTFVLEDDGSVQAEVMYHDLTGNPIAAHIHQGPPGVPGGIISGFGVSGLGQGGTLTGEGTAVLSEAQQQTLFAGGMYFNMHTPQNPGGEVPWPDPAEAGRLLV